MNFVWNMTEKNWRNFLHDSKKKNIGHFSEDCDYYGNCCIGNLCAEIMHTCDDSDETSWYSYTNIYALGIDDGYGYTRENETPYTLISDGFQVPANCKTFESFKATFEKRFEELIESNEKWKELANMPLGNWD
jgi:hypothetical protein